MPSRKKKLSLLINIIAPARLALYSGLADHFELQISHGGTEGNRDSWQALDEKLPNARVRRAWGWQISLPRKENGKQFDRRFIHITPGYIAHLLSFRPDVVISNEMGLRSLIALAYGAIFRKPVLVWWGGTPHTERKTNFARRLLRALISRWARHWISYGQTSTEYLLSLGIYRGRIVEIQNAVDETLFFADAAPELDIQPRPVVLYAGQLIARKGVELLIDAASAAQREGDVFSLLLVGNGRDKQALEAQAKSEGLGNIRFLPSRPPEKMPAIYRSADVLIFPTLEDVWGLVANEAILCGLPVLCSKYAGCASELFSPESVFDPENPLDFRHKFRRAISGQLPKPDRSRLKTTPQLLGDLIRAIEGSAQSTQPSLSATGARIYE